MEILAPAGDMDMLRAAVFSGADCVYLGINGFNARQSAANFSGDALKKAVNFCHARNCKVYAAINTLVFPGGEKLLQEAVLAAANAGCNAIIVQDLYTAAFALSLLPKIKIHASTQMSVHSLAGVQQLAKMGFSRAILARELSQAEIAHIAQNSPIELEVFVHGALCVSVSGQCFASVFLGGRSANRGACAGTCRLPFCSLGAGQKKCDSAKKTQDYHFSLKDLSILSALPSLEKMGIKCAKIEGRLRGAEYCAAVVDSAKKCLNKEEYDEDLLQNVFSRSGFTCGWFNGKNGANMFGVRTEKDMAATKKALPKVRQLYRREAPRVPVEMALKKAAAGAQLTVCDDKNTVRQFVPLPPLQNAVANVEYVQKLQDVLQKTGGTPFYLCGAAKIDVDGVFVPPQALAQARRSALDELLLLRENPPKKEAATVPSHFALPLPAKNLSLGQNVAFRAKDFAQNAKNARGRLPFCAHFENAKQMPNNCDKICDIIILPLFEAEKVPLPLRKKTLLWLPRVMFGKMEELALDAIAKTKTQGFLGYEANNIAHLHLLEGCAVFGGFGLNVTNSGARGHFAAMGCVGLTLSPELNLPQMRDILKTPLPGPTPATSALCYGHMPLFLSRACPIKHKDSCKKCEKTGFLQDRKGQLLPFLCQDGLRSTFNPVALWMAERLNQLPTDMATLYFTLESAKQAEDVLMAFECAQIPTPPFTRGLY